MKRIAVIGSGGAGKSTLARRMGDILGIEVIHLDALYWKPNWTPTPGDEWQQMVEDLAKRDSWIMDGNYGATMEARLAAADTVVYLDFPRTICLWRVIRRFLTHLGKTRPDMGPGCPETIDLEFVGWIWGFPKKSRPTILERLGRCAGHASVITLHSPREVRRFLEDLDPATYVP